MPQTQAFDPNTRSFSNFLEKLDDCAKKTFGGNAQHMIDTLLYAKIPPHRQGSVSLTYFENGTYEQIVTHFDTDYELSSLENDGEYPLSKKRAAPQRDNSKKIEQPKVVCLYCKNQAISLEIRERGTKTENDTSLQNVKPSTSKTIASSPKCQRTNHFSKKCWNGLNVTNRPKRFKQDLLTDNLQDGQDQGNSTKTGLTSSLKNPLN